MFKVFYGRKYPIHAAILTSIPYGEARHLLRGS